MRLQLEDNCSARPYTHLPCDCVGIGIVSEPRLGIAVGMLENMERIKSRELDGGNVSSEHRFLRLNTGGRDKSCPPRSIRFGKKSGGARVADHAVITHSHAQAGTQGSHGNPLEISGFTNVRI